MKPHVAAVFGKRLLSSLQDLVVSERWVGLSELVFVSGLISLSHRLQLEESEC